MTDVPRGGVRRGPAVLVLCACVVLTCAILGATGTLLTPAARAALERATPNPVAVAVDDLGESTAELVATFVQPVDDSAAPAAIDSAKIPSSAADARLLPEALPRDSGTGRRIVYSLISQRVWLVESDGTVSATYLVSGRPDEPAVGTYDVYARSVAAPTRSGQETVADVVRFAAGADGAIGFHTIPKNAEGVEIQTAEQLGQPLSDGGVRQSAADADRLWAWAPVGTVVVVVP